MYLIPRLLLIIFINSLVVTQTTGKITGTIKDAKTNEVLIGVNIIVDGTYSGAATDLDGTYYILNVKPGTYSLTVNMIGYKQVKMENVRVSVNRTSTINALLEPTVIEGETVIVEVDAITTRKDQTSTIKNISTDQISKLPIENIGAVVAMQAGVVEGHFRGGRYNEVTYLIDGIQVDEVFSGSNSAVEIEPEVIQDLEIITGTFNAEYGKAMSGVVNAVTKDGSNRFGGSVSTAFGNYFTKNNDIFLGLDNKQLDRNQDYKFQISGPVIKDKVHFFINTRLQDNKNHLNGLRRFNVTDSSNFYSLNPLEWYSENTGDSSFVSMNGSSNQSILGKLSFSLFSNIRFSTMYSLNQDIWNGYDHGFKYNPDGMGSSHRRTDFLSFHWNHLISQKFFYDIKLSSMKNYGGSYLYENPLDSSYVHDRYLENYGPGFFMGGQQKDHSERTSDILGAKFDFNWQVNKQHSIKSGFQYSNYTIDNKWRQIRNEYFGTAEENLIYKPKVFPDSTLYADIYTVKPTELAAYFQDKMEFDDMVINFGLRYDLFDPSSNFPSDRRNPNNQLSLPDSMMSTYPKADPQVQISPRFGLAYQLGGAAVLHFSYGHFFQMPPMYSLYQNHSFLVAPSDYSTLMGNSKLKAEKTITYEVGLWQELTQGLGLEVSLFYRDIYNLLSTRIISTYNQIEYGIYSNKDYGNVRGLEVKLDYNSGFISSWINYTLQYTRGNADSPTQTFSRTGASMDPVNRFIPMSWDQRHTFNATVAYNKPTYGFSLTGYYNSGSPYTFSPIEESILSRVNLYPNNDYRPTKYHADLMAYYNLSISKKYKINFRLAVYNLFDRLNENSVDSRTGRAYTAVIKDTDRAGHRSNFNKFEDRIENPSMFATPRMIKFSTGINF
jgi:outer membrane receptor protein involved in Fe transport|tara:strand:- start:3672 stop:6341 length:2670 start_codon:yes stop_codon:yes gene_type:complete